MIKHHRTWIEIDKKIFANNIELLKSKLKPGVKFLGMIKANAYGHGAVECGKILIKHGAFSLGVAYLDEAVELRESGITCPILIMAQPSAEDILVFIQYKITPTLYNLEIARKLSEVAVKEHVRVNVHIKIDTGLHRLGLSGENTCMMIDVISKLPGIRIEGIYTHFANAYDDDLNFTKKQFSTFDSIIRKIRENAIFPAYVHAANSAAHVWFPQSQYDLVRFGMAMYGLQASSEKRYPLPVKQCFTWKTKILQIKEVRKGESVGYGTKWHASRNVKTATIAVGYSDGLRRTPFHFEYVLCKGHKAKIISTVTMSQAIIDISHVPGISVDDEVVIIGKQGNNVITFEDVALRTKTINEEIATSISPKISRIYV